MSATFTDPAAPAVVAEQGNPVADGTPRSEIKSVTWRTLRHCAAPPAVVAALACGAAIGSAGTQGALVTDGIYVLAAVAFWLAADGFGEKRRDRRAQRRYRLRRTYRFFVTAAGFVFLQWASFGPLSDGADGWRWNTAALLMGFGALLGLRSLWFGSKWPNPVRRAEEPAPEPTVEAPLELTGAAKANQDWLANVAFEGSPLHGATFTAHDIVSGVQAVVRLIPGRQSVRSINGHLDLIRSGLGWARITVTEDDDDPCLIGLTLTQRTKRSAAAQVAQIPWEGPRVDAQGRVDLGPYQDQQGSAYYHLLGAEGVLSLFVAGDPRTGKSSLLENVAVSCAAARVMTPIVLAHEPADASPLFSKWAWRSAKSAQGVDDALTGIEALIRFRKAQNHAKGWKGFNLSQGRSIIGVFVPEFHRLSEDPKRAARFENIVREGPKVGVMCAFDSQDSTLRAFKNSNTLRNACGRNFFSTFTADGEAKTTLRLAGDPSSLPVGVGQEGWMFGGVHCRREPFRARLLSDEVYDDIQIVEPDAGSANAFESAVPGFLAREAIRDAYLQAFSEAHENGEAAPQQPTEEDLPPLHPDLAVREEQAAAVRGEAVPLPNGGGTLLAFRAPAPMAKVPAVPARTKILRALAVCPLTPGDIGKRTGLSDTTIRQECAKLLAEVPPLLIERSSKHDAWQLTDAGQGAAKAVAS